MPKNSRFLSLFSASKPILGMLHLKGDTPVETVAPEDVKATAELLCAYITDLARDLAKEGN